MRNVGEDKERKEKMGMIFFCDTSFRCSFKHKPGNFVERGFLPCHQIYVARDFL